MKLSLILKWSTLGGILLCSAMSSSALTLGRVRGAVILGQPLELTVPVQIAADEDASGLCFEADVFYGDNRQDSNRIVVTNETSRTGSSVVVRVLAYAHVDEPVITLYLRSGCGLQTTRRYVLLADLASEVAPTFVRPTGAPEPVLEFTSPRASSPLNETPTRAIRTGKVARAATGNTGSTASKPQVDRLALNPIVLAPSQQPAKGLVPGMPHLKLAPLDPTQEMDPTLKISSELIFSSSEDPKKREDAITLWRALNASPEDLLRESARLLAMENDVRSLQDRTSKNRQTVLELSTRLDRAQSQRYSNPLIYGLIALLVACGAALVYGGLRWRTVSLSAVPWWRDQNADGEGALNSAAEDNHLQPDLLPVVKTDPTLAIDSVAGLSEVDIDLQLADSAFSDLGKPAPSALTKGTDSPMGPAMDDTNVYRDFAHSVTGAMREINSQEMIDARQQAEFFMTLGQYEDAIHVLQNCIQDSGESNPQVYLDLLKVFHTLSRKTEYDRYRNKFNQIFKGRIPEYAGFNDRGSGIEGYPEVCEQIVMLWPSAEAVEYIEKCLIRLSEDDYEQEFNLDAYRDLLMLHGVLNQLVPKGSQLLGAERVHGTPVKKSLTALQSTITSTATGISEMIIDLDLSEPVGNSTIGPDAIGRVPSQPFTHASF